ncbi:kynureninase [Plectosphaerella plurivora]|uniref:Kynureninase n=1 Tax=Plectosphaerella plurivora TaxID=936078 RepID=A0A9P8VJE6_9PEZI|nr:kynureninase [Plectosphaerella plurivora]
MASDKITRQDAVDRDNGDALSWLRKEFVIPTKAEVTSNKLPSASAGGDASTDDTPCVYLCGNSLGLQPKRTATRIRQYLDTWATQGVQGHFKPLEGSPLPTWLDVDAEAARLMAPIVGAKTSEVAVMQTLTANLHLLMSAFYKPDRAGKHKIILESKAFPSDHFAVETHIRQRGLDPTESMVCIDPALPGSPLLTTDHIIETITRHADDTALLLLPGIQFYTGQLLDIPRITTFARQRGIFVIWDLAHAAGNVPLSLHEWGVDAAAWCSYKYINGGPGCIASLFVHERHTVVTTAASDPDSASGYVNRLAGWWGNDKSSRFRMENKFHPVPGAAGFQLSNPSVLDTTALCASLEVFEEAGGLRALRTRSINLTALLEELLDGMPADLREMYEIITPRAPDERGAQLSLLLHGEASLDPVMEELTRAGVIVDERRPNVIRVAPAPLYNTFADCYDFVDAFSAALKVTRKA